MVQRHGFSSDRSYADKDHCVFCGKKLVGCRSEVQKGRKIISYFCCSPANCSKKYFKSLKSDKDL